MNSLEMATQLVDRWVSECSSLDPDKRGTLLIQMMAEVIDRTEQEAYNRGWRDGGRRYYEERQ